MAPLSTIQITSSVVATIYFLNLLGIGNSAVVITLSTLSEIGTVATISCKPHRAGTRVGLLLLRLTGCFYPSRSSVVTAKPAVPLVKPTCPLNSAVGTLWSRKDQALAVVQDRFIIKKKRSVVGIDFSTRSASVAVRLDQCRFLVDFVQGTKIALILTQTCFPRCLYL